MKGLARYLVYITWTEPGDDDQRHSFGASGFVIAIGKRWFVITAGHVVASLRNAENIALVNHWHDGVWSKYAVNFPGGPDLLLEFGNADDVDYGALVVTPLLRRELETCGILAMDERFWRKPSTEPGITFLLGIRFAHVQEKRVSQDDHFVQTTVLAPLSLLPVKLVDDPPECLKKDARRVYGRVTLEPDLRLNDGPPELGGVSGGPLCYVVQRGSTAHVWILGVQSGRHARSRTIAACPFDLFAHKLAAASSNLSTGKENEVSEVSELRRLMDPRLRRVHEVLNGMDAPGLAKAFSDDDILLRCPKCGHPQSLSVCRIVLADAETTYVCKNGCEALVKVSDANTSVPELPSRGILIGTHLIRNKVPMRVTVNDVRNYMTISPFPYAFLPDDVALRRSRSPFWRVLGRIRRRLAAWTDLLRHGPSESDIGRYPKWAQSYLRAKFEDAFRGG